LRPVHFHYWPPPHSITNPRVAYTPAFVFLQARTAKFFTNSRQSDDLIRVSRCRAFFQRRTNTNESSKDSDRFSHGHKKNEVPGIVIFSVEDEGNFVSKGGPIYASVTGLNFSQLNENNFPSKRQRI